MKRVGQRGPDSAITSRMLAIVFIIADLIKWLLFQTGTAPTHYPSLLRAGAKIRYFITEADFTKNKSNKFSNNKTQ